MGAVLRKIASAVFELAGLGLILKAAWEIHPVLATALAGVVSLALGVVLDVGIPRAARPKRRRGKRSQPVEIA